MDDLESTSMTWSLYRQVQAGDAEPVPDVWVREPAPSRIKTEGPRQARLARRPNEGLSAAAPQREEMMPKVHNRSTYGAVCPFW